MNRKLAFAAAGLGLTTAALGYVSGFYMGLSTEPPPPPAPPAVVLADDAVALVTRLKPAVPEGKYANFAQVIVRSDGTVTVELQVDYTTIAQGKGQTLNEARAKLKYNSEAISRALSP